MKTTDIKLFMIVFTDGPSKLRADLLRYLVIYEYGGVYFDLDTVSVKSLDNFVRNHTCSLALEPAEHYFIYFKKASVLQHPCPTFKCHNGEIL